MFACFIRLKDHCIKWLQLHSRVMIIVFVLTSILALAFTRKGFTMQALGKGFTDHGVAAPISNCRGLVATVGANGRNVILLWLFDVRGGYALLMIDEQTGKTREFPMPFDPEGDCPYSSILSSANKYYTHFNSHFVEFDPVAEAFTFCHSTTPQMAMSMTEDDNGVIWSATFPNSGLVSFDPKTQAFVDYGSLYEQNWAQYPRYLAADDAGWIYFGLGETASQIVSFNPATREATPLLPEDKRAKGLAYVYRDMNGKVYGHPLRETPEGWYEFHAGRMKKIETLDRKQPKPIITGSQGLFHGAFPNGTRLLECDLAERTFTVENSETGKTHTRRFDYTSEGARLMGFTVAPDETICGGTFFPHRFFRYDPEADLWTQGASYGQWNIVETQGDRFFVGGYPAGFLLEWDPSQPWIATDKDNPKTNPRFLTECTPDIHRSHVLLACPDNKTLVLGGTPAYGFTGGGLMFWNRENGIRTLLNHTSILPNHSTMSLVALADGKILGGTTIAPGTGGECLVNEAELYVMDMTTKTLEWHAPVIPNAGSYTHLCLGPDRLVYGFANRNRFFVFDPIVRKLVHEQDTEPTFGPTNVQQGPRVFVQNPSGATYILFVKGIARVSPKTFEIQMLAESPVPIGAGGAFLNNRIYFSSSSHLYSYELPQSPQ